MPSKKVVMRHPKVEQTITVSERTVPIHEKSGWKVAGKSHQPKPDEADES